MAAPSPVLYALHHSLEPQGFENLCVDLLIREGHSRIIPGGKSRDHGRDAEIRYWTDSKQGHPQTAFQFSQEAKWETKLRKDIDKITQHSDLVDRIIFVSSRSITVEKQDKLRAEFRSSHRISLEIFDEGWFRVRLEEEHIDLALKHLGVEVPLTPGFHASQIKIHGLTDENKEVMLRHTTPEKLRATLSDQAKRDPNNSSAWKGLANVCYFTHDYENALLYASKALKTSRDEVERWNLTALKATIFAEQGIATGSRLLMKKAKEHFLAIITKLGRAVDYYNLANVLGALEHTEAAEAHYRRCLEIDPSYAQAWKNLGSLLVKSVRYEEGVSCLDRALELNPDLLEALCTKANVLVMHTENLSEALELMDRAFALDPDLELRWQHAHYWQAMALCRQDRLAEALVIVEDRLERKPNCPYLGRLANDIFAKLWRSDPNYIQKAEKFFLLRIDPRERDYHALIEVLDLLNQTKREDEAWLLLNQFLNVDHLSIRSIAERIPLSILDLTDSFASVGYYRRFRDACPLGDYSRIIDGCGLRPHNDVPEILFHLLMPAYFRMGKVFQDSLSEAESDDELEVLLETYRLVSRTFSAFGGLLLASEVPDTTERKSELLAAGVIIGLDIPLMEISRLLGYLLGIASRDIPERYRKSVIENSSSIHESWTTEFFEAMGVDWGIKPWMKL